MVMEQQGMASDVHMGFGDLPMVLSHQPAFDVEGSSFIHFGEEAKPYQHVVAELGRARYGCDFRCAR